MCEAASIEKCAFNRCLKQVTYHTDTTKLPRCSTPEDRLRVNNPSRLEKVMEKKIGSLHNRVLG